MKWTIYSYLPTMQNQKEMISEVGIETDDWHLDAFHNKCHAAITIKCILGCKHLIRSIFIETTHLDAINH